MTEKNQLFKADPEIMNLLRRRFNIVADIEFKEFDLDFSVLASWLDQNRKIEFAPDDRLLVVHFDNDFYLRNGYGINLNNLFDLWTDLDVPLFAMLLYTSHVGISKEVEEICQHLGALDRPTVIETVINPGNYCPSGYPDRPLETDRITHHALCLLGGNTRSHRWATYNHLKHLPTSRLAMTVKSCT